MYQLPRVGPGKTYSKASAATSGVNPTLTPIANTANWQFNCVDGIAYTDYGTTYVQRTSTFTVLAANRGSRWGEGQIINVPTSFEAEQFGVHLSGGYSIVGPAKIALCVVFGEVPSVPAAGSNVGFTGSPLILAYSPPVAISDERCLRAITWNENVNIRHGTPVTNSGLYAHGVFIHDGGTGVNADYWDRAGRWTFRTFNDSPKALDPTR